MGRNRRGGGTKQAAVWASSFDAAQPASFYLLDKREVLESLADAVLSVKGVELPVHSQVCVVVVVAVVVAAAAAVAAQEGIAARRAAALETAAQQQSRRCVAAPASCSS